MPKPGTQIQLMHARDLGFEVANAKLDSLDCETILGFADCNMRVNTLSRKIYVTRNGIEYRIRRIRKRTGLNPKNFHDLCRLVEMAKEGGGIMMDGGCCRKEDGNQAAKG